MADTYCPDSRSGTEVVFDHSSGHTICSECGLVLHSHSVDQTSEWRNFSNDINDKDPSRVGGPINLLLQETVIAKTTGAGGGSNTGDKLFSSTITRWQKSSFNNPERSIQMAFSVIGTMCDRLGLVTTIKDQACEMCKKVEDLKPLRWRNLDAICAACLYLACRIENKARTITVEEASYEIYSVANGATKKDIGRASDFIKKQLDGEGQAMEVGTVHAGDLLRRFCSKLGMSNLEIKAAHEAVQKADELDIRRIPKTVAAAVIYIISQLSSNKRSLKVISTTTDVAEGTIKNLYKDIQPYLLQIIPCWYASEKDIKKLSRP